MLRILLLMYFLLNLLLANSQQIIQGFITDKKDLKPLSGCTVLLKDTVGNIVKYSIADAEGKYILYLKDLKKEKFVLEASMLGYYKQKINIDQLKSVINFVLESSPIELNEVKVTATKINQKGDTLNYTVSSFKEAQDRVIGDVLKKIPGIVVSPDGTIIYNGKAINKFYIEGMDLLEGKYNMATNNIPVDAISYIQVFENHQDKKVLQDKVFSDQAALNIKLTDKAKSKLLWNIEPGIGMKPLLWDSKLFLLQLAKQVQGLSVYKTNNTGDELTKEIKDLTVESLKKDIENKVDESNLVSLPYLASPELSSRKILFNNSHVISTNNLIQLKNEYQLRINIDYINDVTKQTNSNYLKYFEGKDTSINIYENYHSIKKQKAVTLGTTLTANKKNYYLFNSFSFSNAQIDNEIKSSYNDWSNQSISTPKQSIKNEFSFIKTISNTSFQFYSFNTYSMLPQQLCVSPGLYASVFNQSNDYNALLQKTKMMSFLSNTSFSLKKSKGHWSNEYLVGVLIQSQNIYSALQKVYNMPVTLGDSVVNNFNLNRFQYQFKPNLEYLGEKVNLSIEIPTCFTLLKSEDSNNFQKETYKRFNILPSVNFHYQLSSFWYTKASYEYAIVFGDIHELVPNYMLSDYRTFIKNDGILKEQKKHIFSFGLYYKNAIEAMFSSFSFIYTPISCNTISDTRVIGALAWQKQSAQYNNSNLWVMNGRVSKMFDIMPITVWFDVTINHNSAFQLFQNTLSNYVYQTIQLNPKIHFRIATWSNIDYKIELSKAQIERVSPSFMKYDPINKISHVLSWFIIPTKKIQFCIEGEYLKMKNKGNYYPNDLFLDTSIEYKMKNISLAIECRNLLNIKSYSYSTIDNLSIATTNYELRPFNILLKLSLTL